jgi:hypothetical protein
MGEDLAAWLRDPIKSWRGRNAARLGFEVNRPRTVHAEPPPSFPAFEHTHISGQSGRGSQPVKAVTSVAGDGLKYFIPRV